MPLPPPPPICIECGNTDYAVSDAYNSDKVNIDLARFSEGLITVLYTGEPGTRVKLRLTKADGNAYCYDLNSTGSVETFNLTQGSGTYTLEVLEHVQETCYTPIYTTTLQLSLTDEKAPYLSSTQFVYYEDTSQAVRLAQDLTTEVTADSEKTAILFDYVVDNLRYDQEKMETVEPGYLPDIDNVLAQGKGICFDYAVLLCAMLRSQDIPCKLVMGNASDFYHAWVEVWCETGGEIDGSISLPSEQWTLLDPTFVSSARRSDSIFTFVGDRANYEPTKYY